MKTATIIVATLATAFASPLAPHANKCNAAPAGTANANVKAIATITTAKVARDCQAACNANAACQSFVFGLPAASSTPQCLLFSVPAAQVPAQAQRELFVFDKACTTAQVPNTAPTHAQPRGNVNTGKLAVRQASVCNTTPAGANTGASPLSMPTAANSRACQTACKQNSRCQSFVFGLPSNAQTPVCRLFAIPAAQVPNLGNNLNVFDKACAQTQVPNTTPTRDAPQGRVSNGATAPNTGNNGNNNNQKQGGNAGQKSA